LQQSEPEESKIAKTFIKKQKAKLGKAYTLLAFQRQESSSDDELDQRRFSNASSTTSASTMGSKDFRQTRAAKRAARQGNVI